MLLKKHIPINYIFDLIRNRFLLVFVIAGSISYFDKFFEGWGLIFPIIPEWFPGLLGTSITLILAFRTNQSYERWWESRKLWGAIVNDSRALIREVNYMKVKNVSETKHKIFVMDMSDLVILWLHLLKDSLRGKDLSPHQFLIKKLAVKKQGNMPNAVLDRMAEIVQDDYNEGHINDFHQHKLMLTINNLGASMGACERIKNSVFPQLYSKTIDFAIWVFVLTFPIAFRDPNEYVEFPIVLTVSMIFMILEKTAVQIQDPFQGKPTDVPMDTIVYGIEKIVRENEGGELPNPLKDYVFYEM